MPRHESEPIMGSIELIDIAPYEHSPLISKCTVKVCYVQDSPNRNKSIITKETGIKMAPSLRGAIIAGYFNKEENDFEEHNRKLQGYENGKFIFSSNTRPYGFVDINAKVWYQDFLDDDGETRTYLCTEGWLWTNAYPEAKALIEEGKGQSMELDDKTLDATWAKDEYGKPQFFIINDAVVESLIILGEKHEPCFEGASFSGEETQFSLNDDFKERVFTMLTELKELLKEGGEKVEENMTPEIVEENPEVIVDEYKKKETEDEKDKEQQEDTDVKEKEDSSDDEEDKKKKKDYALEYATLQEEYNTLKEQYALLEDNNKKLESEIASLRTFKMAIDRKAKQDMINSFSMLTDEDKADVIKNIDTYTVDDIEAKLSVICVRNKRFDFALEEKQEDVTTYNLNDGIVSEPEIPAWIRAINEVVAEKGI